MISLNTRERLCAPDARSFERVCELHLVDQEIAYIRLDHLPAPRAGDPLTRLPEKLREVGYDEERTALFPRRQLGLAAQASLLYDTRHDRPADVLCRLFLLSRWVDKEKVEAALGRELLERACQWGLLADVEGRIGSTVDLYPVDGDYVATDRQIIPGYFEDAVYALGGDSFGLARLIPRTKVKRALDLCTGSGVQALATRAEVVHGVDVNPRAVDFAFFNLSLNRPRLDAQVFQGNLYEALPDDDPYDLIVTNPPWVPAPTEEMELFRGGGGNGELITEAVTRGVPSRLTEDGLFVMYVEYPHYQGRSQSYHQRLREWLGPGPWGIAELRLRDCKAQEYVEGQVVSHRPGDIFKDFQTWMELYSSEGIERMSWAVVYVKRQKTDWDVTLEGLMPGRTQGWVERWLEGLDDRPGGTHKLCPEARLWTSGDQVRVEWPDTCLTPLVLSPEQAAVVRGTSDDPALRADLRRRFVLTLEG